MVVVQMRSSPDTASCLSSPVRTSRSDQENRTYLRQTTGYVCVYPRSSTRWSGTEVARTETDSLKRFYPLSPGLKAKT